MLSQIFVGCTSYVWHPLARRESLSPAQHIMQEGVTLATQPCSPETTPTLACATDGSGNHAQKSTQIFYIPPANQRVCPLSVGTSHSS